MKITSNPNLLLHPTTRHNHRARHVGGQNTLARSPRQDVFVPRFGNQSILDAELNTQLMEAAKRGEHTVVSGALKAGAKVDTRDQHGYTPLIHAAKLGHNRVVQVLLEHPDVDPNTKTTELDSALHWAAHQGHQQVTNELIKAKNIDINCRRAHPVTHR